MCARMFFSMVISVHIIFFNGFMFPFLFVLAFELKGIYELVRASEEVCFDVFAVLGVGVMVFSLEFLFCSVIFVNEPARTH